MTLKQKSPKITPSGVKKVMIRITMHQIRYLDWEQEKYMGEKGELYTVEVYISSSDEAKLSRSVN